MKDGLLIYKKYNNKFNIGDYIQSLAAKQFLHKPIIYVNRERLDKYSGDEIKLIMNGWFLHEPEHWPPSNHIKPFFISYHLNSVAYSILEKENSINYFKKYEPIGCRDKKTRDILLENGIDAYFSGCLTLTLGEKYKSKESSNNKIYFVDPYFKIEKSILEIIKNTFRFILNYNKVKALTNKVYSKTTLKSLYKATLFFNQYKDLFEFDLLLNSEYISHIVNSSGFDSEEDILLYAEDLLRKYSNAKMVITSRIHCALPCLSLETPVLYTDALVHEETSSCRLDGLKELFHTIKIGKKSIYCNLIKPGRKIDSSFSFVNKKLYNNIRIGLLQKINTFNKPNI